MAMQWPSRVGGYDDLRSRMEGCGSAEKFWSFDPKLPNLAPYLGFRHSLASAVPWLQPFLGFSRSLALAVSWVQPFLGLGCFLGSAVLWPLAVPWLLTFL